MIAKSIASFDFFDHFTISSIGMIDLEHRFVNFRIKISTHGDHRFDTELIENAVEVSMDQSQAITDPVCSIGVIRFHLQCSRQSIEQR